MKAQIIRAAAALSAAGLIAIAGYEGYSPVPYKDIAGVWTDNFGNTGSDVGKVKGVPGALKQLGDNTEWAQAAVRKCVKRPMTQGQFDAFTSHAYHYGETAFCTSTIVNLFNAGDSVGACNQLPRWACITVKSGYGDTTGQCATDKINKKFVQGLADRGEKEKAVCLQN